MCTEDWGLLVFKEWVEEEEPGKGTRDRSEEADEDKVASTENRKGEDLDSETTRVGH